MAEGQPAQEAVRGKLVSTAIALYGNEAAEICGLLLDSSAGVLARLQVPCVLLRRAQFGA
jgi:hypothetical protein